MSGMASPVMHMVPEHVVPKKATGEEKAATKRRHGMNGNLVALDIGMICVTSNVGNLAGPIYGRKCGQNCIKNYSTVPLCVNSHVPMLQFQISIAISISFGVVILCV